MEQWEKAEGSNPETEGTNPEAEGTNPGAEGMPPLHPTHSAQSFHNPTLNPRRTPVDAFRQATRSPRPGA
jgi:hypothetical protein